MSDIEPNAIGEAGTRWLAVTAAIVSVVVSILQSVRITGPGYLYVDGSGVFADKTISSAGRFRSIQEALRWAIPGDTIVIADGRYQERLTLRQDRVSPHPITIQALHPGQVFVDWSVPLSEVIQGPWNQEGDGILSAETHWPVFRVQHGEESLFREIYGGVDNLRRLVRRENAFSSFYWANDRLYVWLKPEAGLKVDDLEANRRVPRPREWGEFRSANLTIHAANAIVRGLQFRTGIGCSIRALGESRLTIEDCSFNGATYGVQCDETGSAKGAVSVRRCIYHNFPQHHWRRSWLDWNEIYAGHASSCLISSTVAELDVEDCVALHVGDGLRVSNQQNAEHPRGTLQRNIVAFGTDDAFELEGPAQNVDVLKNLVIECHESLGLSPVETGPVRVTENFFLHEYNATNGAQIKLINRPGSSRPIQNILIARNVFVGNWLCWMQGPTQDVTIEENVFCVDRQAQPPWPEGTLVARNSFPPRRSGDDVFAEMSGMEEVAQRLRELRNETAWPEVAGGFSLPVAGPRWWNWMSPATADLKACMAQLKTAI